MKREDITEAAPYLVNVIAKTLVSRRLSPFVVDEGFDHAFKVILSSNIQTVCASVIGYSEKYDLEHSLNGACTNKLKQAVLDEIRLIELDRIT